MVPESAACASKSERQPDQTRYPPSQLTDVKIATIKIIVIKMIVIMRRRTTLGVGLGVGQAYCDGEITKNEE